MVIFSSCIFYHFLRVYFESSWRMTAVAVFMSVLIFLESPSMPMRLFHHQRILSPWCPLVWSRYLPLKIYLILHFLIPWRNTNVNNWNQTFTLYDSIGSFYSNANNSCRFKDADWYALAWHSSVKTDTYDTNSDVKVALQFVLIWIRLSYFIKFFEYFINISNFSILRPVLMPRFFLFILFALMACLQWRKVQKVITYHLKRAAKRWLFIEIGKLSH